MKKLVIAAAAATVVAGAAMAQERYVMITHTQGTDPFWPVVEKGGRDAAAAIGCEVAQIAKSLIFRGKPSERPILVIAAGTSRVDVKKVGTVVGEKIGRADADFVREKTGFAIGGVPPVGHATPPVVVIDEALLSLDHIWAAAGTPNAVFQLRPADLPGLTGGTVATIAE